MSGKVKTTQQGSHVLLTTADLSAAPRITNSTTYTHHIFLLTPTYPNPLTEFKLFQITRPRTDCDISTMHTVRCAHQRIPSYHHREQRIRMCR